MGPAGAQAAPRRGRDMVQVATRDRRGGMNSASRAARAARAYLYRGRTWSRALNRSYMGLASGGTMPSHVGSTAAPGGDAPTVMGSGIDIFWFFCVV